jgi:hypothetical protein
VTPLRNASRKAIVAVSLPVWFVPSCFLLHPLAKNGTTAMQRLWILPTIYGFTATMWLRALLERRWFHWTLAVILSLALPVGLVILMVRTPRWRPVILVVGFIISCALTAAAYCLLLA